MGQRLSERKRWKKSNIEKEWGNMTSLRGWGRGEGFQGYRTMVADWPLPLACSPSLWMLEKREVSLLAQCTLDVEPGRVNVKHSWIGHFTVTMTLSLSIKTNKWVPANGCWNSRGGWKVTMIVFHPILTRWILQLPEVINMLLLPLISIHYPANSPWKYSNSLGRSSFLDQTPNSHNQFTMKCVAIKGENVLLDLES